MRMFAVIMLPFLLCPVFFQQTTDPILVAEFSKANCEEMLAYVDQVMVVLNHHQGSRAVAVFYPKRDKPENALQYEDVFRKGMVFRGVNKDSIKIVRGKPSESTTVQLSVVAKGAKEPEYAVAQPGEMFTEVTKPFLYNTEFGGEVCPAADEVTVADVLKFNPNVGLRIVIRGKNRRYVTRKMQTWLYRLTIVQKVPRDRIRIRWTKRLGEYYPYQDVEFWLVPSNR